MEANKILEKPPKVTLAVYMLYISLGISVIVVLVSWVRFGLPGWVGYKLVAFLIQLAMFHFWAPIGVMIYGNLIILPIAFWLYLMIGKGKNWARITLLVYVILEILFTIGSLGFSVVMRYHLVHVPSLSDWFMRISPEIVQDVFQIVALTFLFGRASSDWFKAIKNHNKRAMTKPKIGITRVALGLLTLLIGGVVLRSRKPCETQKKTTILWIVLTFFMWAAFVPKQVAFGESNLRWHWFSALSLKDDWRILGEVADVVFEGGKLRAELYDVKGNHRMSVTGSVTNDKINATVIRHGTDDEASKIEWHDVEIQAGSF